MKIVITTGFNKSLHSIALIHKISQIEHIDVVACLQVKTYQLGRFKKYLKQYGLDTVIAKFKSYLLNQDNTYLSDEIKPIKEYLKELNINFKTINSYCKSKKIQNIKVNSLNSEESINFIKKNNIDLVLYSGGGILKNEFINSPNSGILNAHSGYLPFFRGMNTIEWSLLYGFFPYTTIHFINSGIDTGSILYREKIKFNDNLYIYRGNAVVHNIKLLYKVVSNFSYYKKSSISQLKNEGRQFFVMHDFLKFFVIKFLSKKGNLSLLNDYKKNNKPNFE